MVNIESFRKPVEISLYDTNKDLDKKFDSEIYVTKESIKVQWRELSHMALCLEFAVESEKPIKTEDGFDIVIRNNEKQTLYSTNLYQLISAGNKYYFKIDIDTIHRLALNDIEFIDLIVK